MASSVTIDFNANIARFTSSLDKATNDLAKFQTNAQRMAGNLKGVFATIGGSISVAGFVKFATVSINAAKEAEQASNRIAATLRATGNAAGLTKGQIDDLADSMAKTTQFDDESLRNASSALLKFGNIQGDVFRQAMKSSADLAAFLGTDVADAAQQVGAALAKGDDGIGRLAKQFGDLPQSSKDAITAFEAVGDSAGAMQVKLDFIQSKIGGVAEQMNTGLTKATSDLSKAWGELAEAIGKSKVGDILQTEMSSLSLFMTDLTNQINGTSNAFRKALSEMAKDTAKFMPGVAGAMTYGFGAALDPGQQGQRSQSGFIKGGQGDPAVLAAQAEERRKAEASAAKAAEDKKNAAEAAKKSAEQAQKASEAFIQSIQKQAATVGMSKVELLAYEAAHAGLSEKQMAAARSSLEIISTFENQKTASEEAAEALKRHAEAMEAFNEAAQLGDENFAALAEESSQASDAATESYKQQAQAIKQLLDPTIQLQNQVAEIQALGQLELLDPDEVADGIAKVTSEFDKAQEKLKDTDDLAKDLGLTFTSAFEDAIVGGKEFSDVLSGLADDIQRILVRRTITEPLDDMISGMLNSADFGGGIGDFFGDIFGGFRASGGPVNYGKAYVVGEKGPELFMPNTSGTIVPNGAGGGGGVVVNVMNNAPQTEVQATPRMNNGKMEVEIIVQQVIASDVRRNGPITQRLGEAFGMTRGVA